MAKIAVLIQSLGPEKGEAVAAIRAALSLGIAHILQAVEKKTLLFEAELFNRQDPGFPQRLLGLMEKLDVIHADYAVFEMPDRQSYSPTGTFYLFSSGSLRNIIEGREISLEQQRVLGAIEDG